MDRLVTTSTQTGNLPEERALGVDLLSQEILPTGIEPDLRRDWAFKDVTNTMKRSLLLQWSKFFGST